MASVGNGIHYASAVSFEVTSGSNQLVYTVTSGRHARVNIGFNGSVTSLKVGGREWIGVAAPGMYTDVYMASGQTLVVTGGFAIITGAEFENK